MSGYKRVNFYELCRLCASNQQKEKTHIFREEGRKIQLQNKIQSCLSLTVCENDFLPKVVCSQCLNSLEECYIFRKECVTSESMLSSYFKNFRYTEDFKKSGKVYIKDTTTKTSSTVTQTTTEPVSSTTNVKEQVFALKPEAPMPKNQPTPSYGTNPLNLAAFKNSATKQVVAEALGSEIINIAQLVDFESLVCQTAPKTKKKKQHEDPNLIKIELAQGEHNDFDLNQLKLPHIKTNPNQNKFAYSIKIDEAKGANQAVILNSLPDFNQNAQQITQVYQNTVNPISTNVNLTTQIVNQKVQTTNPVHSNFQQVVHTTTTKQVNYVENTEFVNKKEAGNFQIPPKSHTCDICRKTFKRREHLYQHVKLHTGFRPFAWENCSKSFMRKEHLLRHMTSHSGQKNHTCDVCEKSFSRNDNLLKHRKTHEKQNSFTCEVCQKQFVMRHYYVAHKMAHETEKCGGSGASWGLLKV